MPKYQHKYDQMAVSGLAAKSPSGSTWAGLVNVTSQANNLVTVSAQAVDATDLILLSTKKLGTETVPFHGFGVASVNPTVGFVISPVCSVAALVTSYQVSFMVVKA